MVSLHYAAKQCSLNSALGGKYSTRLWLVKVAFSSNNFRDSGYATLFVKYETLQIYNKRRLKLGAGAENPGNCSSSPL